MEYKAYENTLVVRLDKGDEIVKSLSEIAKIEKLTLAQITGIGATDDFTVGVFDLTEGDYERIHYTGNNEINSIMGNFTTKDGNPYIHLHITCTGAGGKVVGGHLFEANVSLTAEIFIQKINGSAERSFDKTAGINKIRF